MNDLNDSKFYVDPTARINYPLRFLEGCVRTEYRVPKNTTLPKHLYIGPYAVVGENVVLGERVIIDAHCTIDPNVTIGDDTLLIYRASVGGGTKIGRNCVIGGFIPENCTIGNRCRVFGNIVHRHTDSTMSWDHHDIPEVSPVIHDDSFIGFGAILAGGIHIGPRAYVCAGAIITRAVPPYHIAFQTNEIIHYSEWNGALKTNPIFAGEEE